jgi:hypothetical protein
MSKAHRGGYGSIPGQVAWDLLWTLWNCGWFPQSNLVSCIDTKSADCSKLFNDSFTNANFAKLVAGDPDVGQSGSKYEKLEILFTVGYIK